MHARPLAAGLAAATLLVTSLSGCGRDDRALTVGGNDTGSDTSSVAAPEKAAGKQLTEAQAKAALLTPRDLPKGWVINEPEAEEDDDTDDTVTPKRCDTILSALEESTGDAPVEAEVEFTKKGELFSSITETISSYDEEIDGDALGDLAAALTECPTFTTIDGEGTESKITIKPMSIANLGDQSLAFGMTVDLGEGWKIPMSVLFVNVGHNSIALANLGTSGKQLQSIGKAAIKRLESATR
jgi:hypothetical protein